MEEEKDTMSPVWMQDGSANGRHLRRTNSIFFNSGALLIFLLVTALAFIFIIAPTLHSFTSHIFKPHSVKRTWDSLNLVLVLFAILCGFLSRNNNNNTTNEETPRSYSYQDQSFSVSDTTQDYTKTNPETETQRSWYEYEYSDRTGYSYKSFNRLRSINSYPDLRQESSWVNSDERWRFYDDTHINGYQDRRQRPVTEEEEKEEELGIKNLEVYTFEVSKKEVPSAPPSLPAVAPPSPPPPPHGKDVRRKGKRTYQAVGKAKNHDLGAKRSQPPLPSTPPPPPPIPTEKTVKEKNRSKSATKEFLISLKGKKKKQRHRSLENFESILNYSKPHTLSSQPPPPPPPPSVFESLFSSKKMKHKKPHISSSKTEAVKGATTLKPRQGESFYTLKENVSAGNESPLNIPIPPPPPPPFNLPAWKFRVKGDFVRIDSNSSTSSDLPDLEEVLESPKASSEVNQCNSNDGGEPEIPLFYPSPDVNTKANTFIEKFRAGLRMEKMNSTKSNLGPSINTQTKEAGPSSRYKAVYVL